MGFYAGDLIRACNLTQPSELLRKLEVSLRRERRPSPRLKSSPCTRHARTPRTRVASMTSLKSWSFVNQRMMMASCPSSPSWKRCALLKSRFSQIRLLRVNKGLQPSKLHPETEVDRYFAILISRYANIDI